MADLLEKPKRLTFADLKPKTYEWEVTMPDGEAWQIATRAMTIPESIAYELSDPRPQPPRKEAHKREGELVWEYNYNDPEYQRALTEWSTRRLERLVVKTVIMDFPGDTEEEQMKALRDYTSRPVLNRLIAVASLTIELEAGSVRRATFQPAAKDVPGHVPGVEENPE